jgi:hypothetical protein
VWVRVTNIFRVVLCGLALLPIGGCAQAGAATPPGADSDVPVNIPLTVVQNPRYGTYSPKISIALGNGKPLPFGFDTGSTGLHVFADANLDAPDSGAQCTQTPTSVTYGNPARITFHGVICNVQLHFEGIATPALVPVAYLTSASCPSTNPTCQIPDLHSPKAMGGYGILGIGLTGVMYADGAVPNPILSLPGRRGSVYSIILTHDGGTLVLGGAEPSGALDFVLPPGTVPGQVFSLPQACLFVDGRKTDACMTISFDTGNGVPWIHTTDSGSIPQQNGIVRSGTRIGWGPPDATQQATSVVAGTSFADSIKVLGIPGHAPITNTSIQGFFGHTVTYDNLRGVIAVSPANP